jgi:hypothetical protein
MPFIQNGTELIEKDNSLESESRLIEGGRGDVIRDY